LGSIIFKGATTYPCILTVEQNWANKQFKICQVETLDYSALNEYITQNEVEISQDNLDEKGWSLVDAASLSLIKRIKASGVSLKEYTNGQLYRGVLTGLNAAFVIDAKTKDELIKADAKSAELIKPFLVGKDVKRFAHPRKNKYLIFTRRGVDIKRYPEIEKYLLHFKSGLQPKPKNYSGTNWKGRKPGGYKWYEIQDAVDYFAEFETDKIIIPAISNRANYCFDSEYFYSNDKTSIIPLGDKYLLGLLNSTLLDFILKSIASTKRGGYFEYKPMYVSTLPIKIIASEKDKEIQGKIILLVDQMFETQKKISTSKMESEIKMFQQKADLIDKQINQLVYVLYDLTKDEIKIIEKN